MGCWAGDFDLFVFEFSYFHRHHGVLASVMERINEKQHVHTPEACLSLQRAISVSQSVCLSVCLLFVELTDLFLH